MNFSIVVCTYNRADSLRQTLECLARLVVPEEVLWEVVVIDNNSTDETRDAIAAHVQRFPVPLRYEFEANQGLSHARNRGIRAAEGDVILFTDDDVCPEPEWAAELLRNMERHGCNACGGYIAPVWEASKPAWLTERFHGYLALRTDDAGPKAITRDSKDTPYGANMAVRKHVFDRYGLFDTARGRKGSTLASGEDGEFFQRLLAADEPVFYFPSARVHHRIEAFRLRKNYFRRWRYQTSRNIAEAQGIPGSRRIAGVPLYLFPQMLHAVHRALVGRFACSADEAFYRELIVYHFLGLISGLYRSHSTRKH